MAGIEASVTTKRKVVYVRSVSVVAKLTISGFGKWYDPHKSRLYYVTSTASDSIPQDPKLVVIGYYRIERPPFSPNEICEPR